MLFNTMMIRTAAYYTVALGLVALLFLTIQPASAQSISDFLGDSTLFIEGTSNQSDWKVTADSLNGSLDVSVSEDGTVQVSALELSVLVAGMKGGKSPIMDRLMNRTLKSTEHKEIVYVLTGSAEAAQSEGGSFQMETVGDLTIAGVTNQIQMTVKGILTPSNQLVFTGSHEMKMTDFEMQPPTALFGALRTKDDIVVHFEMFVDLQD